MSETPTTNSPAPATTNTGQQPAGQQSGSTTPQPQTGSAAPAAGAGTTPQPTEPAPAEATGPTKLVADPADGPLGGTVLDYVTAVRHRILDSKVQDLQQAALAGARAGFEAINGKTGAIKQWRAKVDALEDAQTRAELLGITKAIIQAEIQRRVAFLDW